MSIGNRIGRAGVVAVFTALIAASADSAPPARPSGPDHAAPGGARRYERCLALVKRDAAGGYAAAGAWHAAGGGAAALDCEALALTDLGRFPEAARALETSAAEAHSPPALRAQLLDQAGNAWLLARDAGKAELAFSAALVLDPHNEDVLSDRARERGASRNWSGAFGDLTAVLALDPERADVYVLRASALHAEGHKPEARSDIDHALAIYPGYPEALVERGAIRLESGDSAGARADWREAARAAPDSDAGTAARTRLEQLSASSRKK